MQAIAAKQGIEWIRQGFALFRRQPAELSTLFLLYMLLMFSLSLIPVVGQLLPLLLVPTFTMAFMQACVEIEADRKVRDRKSTRLNSSHVSESRMPSSA